MTKKELTSILQAYDAVELINNTLKELTGSELYNSPDQYLNSLQDSLIDVIMSYTKKDFRNLDSEKSDQLYTILNNVEMPMADRVNLLIDDSLLGDGCTAKDMVSMIKYCVGLYHLDQKLEHLSDFVSYDSKLLHVASIIIAHSVYADEDTVEDTGMDKVMTVLENQETTVQEKKSILLGE